MSRFTHPMIIYTRERVGELLELRDCPSRKTCTVEQDTADWGPQIEIAMPRGPIVGGNAYDNDATGLGLMVISMLLGEFGTYWDKPVLDFTHDLSGIML